MNNEFIAIMTERIVQDFDPLQIILFGSQARGDANRNSDIDLLVVFAELTDKRKTAIDIMDNLSDIPVPKDILVSTPKELRRHRTRIGSVLRYAQQEGKVLWKSWNTAAHRYDPFSDMSVKEEKKLNMQTSDRLEETARWLRYAQEDLVTAETLLEHPDIPPRQCCWHAQQTAEKTLKAALIYLQIDFHRTHNLNELRNMVPEHWQLETTSPNLSNLTRWAVEARYPETRQEVTDTDASEAVEQARSIWTSVSNSLKNHDFLVEQNL